MSSKIVLIVGFLFLFTFVCAENEFNIVPKLYEEVGCTEKKSSDNVKRYGTEYFGLE